jgi:uncharacterized protein YkwD
MLLYFLIVFFCGLHAQEVDYYNSLTVKTFRKEKSFNDSIDFKKIDIARLNAAIFFVTNEIRLKHKLSELEYSPELEKIATMHSCDMVNKGFFSHTNPYDSNKETPNDRAKLTGIVNPYIAENIAEDFGLQYESGSNVYIIDKGQFSYKPEGKPIPSHTYLSMAESLLRKWMNSPMHKKNILSENAIQMGCGACFFINKSFNDMPTFMATQNFQWYEKIKRS